VLAAARVDSAKTKLGNAAINKQRRRPPLQNIAVAVSLKQ
jgi:hypothetical protein